MGKERDEYLDNEAYQREPNRMTYRNGYYDRDYTTLLIEVTFNEFLAISIKSSSITVPKPLFQYSGFRTIPSKQKFCSKFTS